MDQRAKVVDQAQKVRNICNVFTESRTQSLQAFWSAGQRREDSGDIEKIQFFWLAVP